jgi:hypothetical protein
MPKMQKCILGLRKKEQNKKMTKKSHWTKKPLDKR